MRAILIISALAAVAYGRPEPPSGYQYQTPSSRYGAPSGAGGDQGGFRSAGPSSGFGGGAGLGGQSGFGGAQAGAFASASSGSQGRSSDSSSGGIVINKHVYVHVAPPDHEDNQKPKARVHVPPPQKHYKIIFIKAPTPPTPTIPDIPPIQQDEEKTLVYVLVKKPEDQPEIQIPTAAPTEPSKPEVYFIRYKTQNDGSGHGGSGASAGAGQDFSQVDNSLDDTVSIEAASRQAGGAGAQGGQGGFAGNGASQGGSAHGGASQGGASQGGASQAGAFASSQAFSSSGASSGQSSGAPSSQYGAPSARGPY